MLHSNLNLIIMTLLNSIKNRKVDRSFKVTAVDVVMIRSCEQGQSFMGHSEDTTNSENEYFYNSTESINNTPNSTDY